MIKTPTDLSHSFDVPGMDKFCPLVISLHSHWKNSRTKGNKIVSPSWAVEYHFKYAGRICLRTPSNTLDREKNTVHIYAPGSVYWEDTRDADCPIQDTYFYFSGAESCGLKQLVSSKLNFARFRDPDNLAGELFSVATASCVELGDSSFWLVQSCLMRLLQLLSHSRKIAEADYLITRFETARPASTFSRQVEEFLRRNIRRPLTLGEIARHMKTSESQLSHKFKEETGVSPISRHSVLRIDLAKSLILKGEKFKTVAEMTGYGDEYHFSKAFKATTGVPPRTFRQSHISRSSSR